MPSIIKNLIITSLLSCLFIGQAFGQDIPAIIEKAKAAAAEKDYSQAAELYQQALEKDPENVTAKLGLVVAKINIDKQAHESSKKDSPLDTDWRKSVYSGPAKAYEKKTAKNENPKNKSQSSNSYSPRVDFTLLGGFTSSKLAGFTGRSNETNIRFAEFAVEPTRNTRVWFQYDNGLSLDSFALARAQRNVPTYIVGGLVSYKKHYLTKFAFGWRNLPGNISQQMYDIEQVFFLPKNYSYDVGVLIAPRKDKRTETVVHTGVGIPVGEKLRIHPNFFYAQSGLPGEKQMRGLFQAEYRFDNGIKLHPGYAFGREYRRFPLTDNNVNDVFFKFSFPVKKYVRPQFMIRHEAIGASSATIFSFGFTLSNKDLR